MKVLILGGTGVISRAIVDELLARGHEVVLYNRGTRHGQVKAQVETIAGDRQDRRQFENTMRQRYFDAVIDMICFNEQDAQSTLKAFRGNVGQIVVTSSVAAYKRPYHTMPIEENAEELWDNPEFRYAFDKAQVERCLTKAMTACETPITILRPSLTYGPGAANIGVLRQNYGIIDRIRKGKPLVMFGDGTTPWTFTFVPDLARAYAAVLGNPRAYGEAYHVTSEELHIWEDLYLEFGRIVGIEPRIVHLPSELLRQAAPNLCSHLYFEKSHSGIFSNAKFKAVNPEFAAVISLNQGLRTLVNWFEEHANQIDPEKDALEDKLVALHQDWSRQMANLYLK
jgi:nucleoside-diphosphate-sugar epimerase